MWILYPSELAEIEELILGMYSTIFFFKDLLCVKKASQVALVVRNPPANAGDIGDKSSIPGLGRSPGGGHENPLQYVCLENPMNRGA